MLLDLIDPEQPALVAVVGPPGAGKSTFARAYAARLRGLPVVLSLDAFRAEASRYNDPSDQSVTRQAVHELFGTLAAYLSEGRTVVVDATNAERPHRLDLLRVAEPYDALTAAVVILPDLAEWPGPQRHPRRHSGRIRLRAPRARRRDRADAPRDRGRPAEPAGRGLAGRHPLPTSQPLRRTPRMIRRAMTRTAAALALAAATAACHPTAAAPHAGQTGDAGHHPATAASGPAAQQLAELRVAAPGPMAGYSRDQFGHGWDKQPGTACDTREIVLHQQGQGVISDPKTCRATSGTWVSLYDGVTVHDARQLDIDHLVPEAEAWRTGAASWTADQRKKFANDYAGGELVAVTAHSNRSKGDEPPPDYMPARSEWCRYATGWVSVKHTWRLTVTDREREALRQMLNTCR